MNELYKNIRYTAPYNYLINYNIIEFDLEKANISALYEEKYFNKNEYEYYYNLPKQDREVLIGKLIKTKLEIYQIIQAGIINAKRMFFESNNIQIQNILYIDNDSITLVYDQKDNLNFITKFSNIYNFKCKNVYTSFLRLYGIDFLYFNNNIKELYRLKNCNQELLINNHKNGFLDLLLTILYSGQFDKFSNTICFISNIYKQYVNKSLPIIYYKEFNNISKYKILSGSNSITYYIDNDIDQYYLKNINITYNASILQLLYKYFSHLYFQNIYK